MSKKNFRSVGAKSGGGAVVHGSMVSPTSPRAQQTSVPSIPSKFETVLHSGIQEHDGFMSRIHRFDPFENENPGPGTYLSQNTLVRESDSLSKKGYGNGFASKSTRFMRQFSERHQLAPGSYDLETSTMKKPEPYHKGPSASFATPTIKPIPKEPTPGPGEYMVKNSREVGGGPKYATESSAFKAPPRFKVDKNAAEQPAPNQYEPSYQPTRNALMSNPHSSVFQSRTTRSSTLEPRNKEIPGPGTYESDPNVENAISVTNPYSKIKKGAMLSRSEGKIYRHEQPGPGQYQHPDSWDNPAKGGSHSVFVSNAPRLAIMEHLDDGVPGPGKYRPSQAERKSFNANADRRWTH